MNILLLYLAISIQTISVAGCVYGAKDKTKFTLLDNHAIILSGGLGRSILIKTSSYISQNPEITVLKDDFCSYDSAVLYIDGEIIDVTNVEWID